MKVIPTRFPEVLLLEPRVFGDSRGFFFESWNEREFERVGIRAHFVQDNHSRSEKGVLRGLHYLERPGPPHRLAPHRRARTIGQRRRRGAAARCRSVSVKILLTGKNGQVGWELARALEALGEVIAFDRAGLDLAVPDQIVSVVRSARPDVLINAAAYTAVDRAESEPDAAYAINAAAVAVLAEQAKRIRALLVHY